MANEALPADPADESVAPEGDAADEAGPSDIGKTGGA